MRQRKTARHSHRAQRATTITAELPKDCSPDDAARAIAGGGEADVTVAGRRYRLLLTVSADTDGSTRRSLSVRGPLDYARPARLHAMFDLSAQRAIRMPAPGGNASQQRFVAAAREIYAAFREQPADATT